MAQGQRNPNPSPAAGITAADLGLSIAGKVLLDGAAFAIPPGRKVALVGRNGSGKSTLLDTLRAVADSGRPPEHVELRGSLTLAPGTVLASLPQSIQLAFGGPARAYLDAQAGHVSEAWNRNQELTAALAAGRHDDALLHEYGEALEAMERLSAWNYPQRVAEVTAGLGLAGELLGRPLGSLSGGQATRLALAGVLLKPANVILLDEPSNNLDLASLRFLAGWIRGSTTAMILVSHDRNLIDATVDEVLEIEEHTGRLRLFGGNYSFYVQRKREELESQLRRYTEQQERRAQLEASARSVATRAQRFQSASQNDFYRSKGARVAKIAKAQQARIARELNRIAEPEPPAQPRLVVARTTAREGLLLKATGVSFAFGQEAVLREVTMAVRLGDRLALLGPNGSGKSTLLRLLAGELAPAAGTVERAPGLKIAYLTQEPVVDDWKESLLDFGLRRFSGPAEELRAILGKVLFADPARVHTGDVSLGELRRIECAALFASAPDLALLDEPTNHLDLLSIEMLEAAVGEYRRALVVVSHDQRFLESVRPASVLQLGGREAGIEVVTDWPPAVLADR
jgi:ATPase subunit of ABC transporter with duplicated ATPase domains